MDYKKVFFLQYGRYVQVHKEEDPRNTIDTDKTVREIFLEPQYNLQGGYFLESSNIKMPLTLTLDTCQHDQICDLTISQL